MTQVLRGATAAWMVIGGPIAGLALLYATRGDYNWLARLMDAYPVLWLIVIFSAFGPLVLGWWLLRKSGYLD
jgi:hypothetical protein